MLSILVNISSLVVFCSVLFGYILIIGSAILPLVGGAVLASLGIFKNFWSNLVHDKTSQKEPHRTKNHNNLKAA